MGKLREIAKTEKRTFKVERGCFGLREVEKVKEKIKTAFGWDDAELEKKIKRTMEIFWFEEEEDGIAFLYETAKTKEAMNK